MPSPTYIRVSHEKVAQTSELLRNSLVADFDPAGNVVGIEILAPVTTKQIANLANKEIAAHIMAKCVPVKVLRVVRRGVALD